MDVEDEGLVYHPNIQKVNNFNASKNYVRKDYQENIEQAKEVAFLIECWPEALDAGGKKKRKGGFEDDEPGALKANFHNVSKFASVANAEGFCREQIEKCARREKCKSLYLWEHMARMLEPSATWFNRGAMNFDNWTQGDKVVITDELRGPKSGWKSGVLVNLVIDNTFFRRISLRKYKLNDEILGPRKGYIKLFVKLIENILMSLFIGWNGQYYCSRAMTEEQKQQQTKLIQRGQLQKNMVFIQT
ncbi:hypothetical protein C1646_755593 [Rhizophagus diaphanus]|nr:hypothetical protein C1646_755593 [Rhizophagus diaphanus] [Rhizophagus sp. MUCL 43196]